MSPQAFPTRLVCLVCDREKPLSMRVSDSDWCPACERRTGNRSIGADGEPIAPQSALTFQRQREIFNQERRRA